MVWFGTKIKGIEMKRTLYFSAAIAALALSACSPRAASIAPVPMGNAYAQADCNRVASELNETRAEVATLSAAQNSAATADAIGVFLIAVPVSNLTGGNRAGELGAAKGKLIALESRYEQCLYERQQS